MAVTPDVYELPIYICETPQELANELGISRSNVFYHINNKKVKNGYKIIKVKAGEIID